MNDENTPLRIVQDFRYAGPHPFIQYDILCVRALLLEFLNVAPHLYLNSRRLGRILKRLEMRPIGLHFICGRQCSLWTCLPMQPAKGIAAIVRDRLRAGATELHMELKVHEYSPAPPQPLPLFTTFERDVLTQRLQIRGLRYPKAREIAQKLDCAAFQVNFALQVIRRKLHLPTLKDPAALRKAVRESGCLMDDPAFD